MRLIHVALELGVTHFDTARLYGDGVSEKALGAAIRRRNRASATIATKFGLLPTEWIGKLGWVAPPVRGARSSLRRLGVVAGPRRSYTAATMWRSLHASLRNLQTDYVDLLFVHDAALTELDDELLSALSDAKRAGKVRFVGVSGFEAIPIFRQGSDVIDAIQMPEAEWPGGRPLPDFTYGIVSAAGALQGGVDSALASAAVSAALARRETGSVIIGTRNMDHLRAAVAAADTSLK
jgi:D-threo-aldose 1-dehydrogenase